MFEKILFVGSLFLLSACGNNWMNSNERKNTPSARSYAAKMSYDKGDYSDAMSKLESALADDPTNVTLRMQLAYTYNAMAGMGMLDIIKNASKTGTALHASADSTTAGITQMTAIIGFKEADRTALIAAIGTSTAPRTKMSALRELNTKLQYAHKSWLTLCPILPNTTLTAYIGTDTKIISGLESASCNGGIDKAETKSAAEFAAALATLAEGVIVFGSVVDQNQDGVLDIQLRAQTVNDNISAIDKSTSSATSSAQINSLLDDLNKNLKELDAIGQEANGEVISTMIAEFQLAASLLGNIKGIPDSLKTKINDSISSFEKSKVLIDGYLSKASSTSRNTQISNSTATASGIISKLNTKISGLSAASQAESKEKLKDACSNYGTASNQFNIPTGTAASVCASNSLWLEQNL